MDASGDREALRQQLRSLHERTLAAGDVLFAEGEAGDTAWFVVAGELELLREGPDGPRRQGCRGPGDVAGELEALAGGSRRSRAVARGETRVLAVDAATLRRMCAERPDIGARLLVRIAAHASQLAGQLADLDADDLHGALARALLRRGDYGAGELRSVGSLRELAGEAGVALWSAYRGVQALAERRLVQIEPEGVRVPDPEALQACVLDHAT